MNKAKIIFTIRPFNPISLLIRWALPVSRFKWAKASHSMIVDGDHIIHATIKNGVIRAPYDEAMRGQKIVAVKSYDVSNLEAGLAWARKKAADNVAYDFKGAFGISLEPDRNWQSEDKYFCHELCATFLHKCERKIFDRLGHVTDTALLLTSERVE